MWPLEFIIGPLAKGFALTVRLLANMTGGHVIILVLIGFIFQFKTLWIAPVSVVGATVIYMLEIFVAFLQAFIFALLSALFMGQMMHRH
jgi:F-type H+-transporting ATPase subunit a